MLFGFNKYVVYVIVAVTVLAVASTAILMWKASIRREALLEFNNKQLEQTVKEQQKFLEDMKAVNANQKKIIDDMTTKNEELSKQLKSIEDFLDSDEAKKNDRESSDLLKRTIKELSGQK